MPVEQLKNGKRRIGTRVIHPGDLISEHRHWWHGITVRAWLLLVPFLGTAWASLTYVRPELEILEEQMDAIKQEALSSSNEARGRGHDAFITAVTRARTMEETVTPRLLRQRAMLDSLSQCRKAMEREPYRLQAELDSLRTLFRQYENESGKFRGEMEQRDSLLAGLRSERVELQDSLAMMERAVAHADDELASLEQNNRFHQILRYTGYLAAPALGAIWAQSR